MQLSVFDLFKIGLGPSSSHTVGPMKAALDFARGLDASGLYSSIQSVKIDLYGSLALTGKGHATDTAILLGLSGYAPDTIDPDTIAEKLAEMRQSGTVKLNGQHPVMFVEAQHLVMHRRESLPHHPNGMRFTAFDAAGSVIQEHVRYSIGGGFVVTEHEITSKGAIQTPERQVRYPFKSADELLSHCHSENLSFSSVILANEAAWRSEAETREGLLKIWAVMQACVRRGLATGGILPGGLKVVRRAPALYAKLQAGAEQGNSDPLEVMDWITLYALAVNEENAAGGRVVTAPTNGAAGIIPAVLHYYVNFVPKADEDGVIRFLLAAAAVGFLFKTNASISGAEVGCQGEVGVACSMAAAGLAEVMGGTPEQVENAAEIGMEHNLGLTCDPIAGLVQVPCIERNAVGACKAVHASRIALHGTGKHLVSLDKVIRTMRITGADMKNKYKETSKGGLAVGVPVSAVDC